MEFSENTKSGWAAYFGGATVVASLLLVAWEIRQNTVALSAQALQDLNFMPNEILLAAAENDQLSQVQEKRNQDISSLTGAEYQQYWGYNYALMTRWMRPTASTREASLAKKIIPVGERTRASTYEVSQSRKSGIKTGQHLVMTSRLCCA